MSGMPPVFTEPTQWIAFDYVRWVAMFPELAGIDQAPAQGYFDIASMYIRNDGRGPVRDPVRQSLLLYLATAHIARLFSARTNGNPATGGSEGAPPLVGRIDSAAEGSVNVSAEMPEQPMGAAWWNQTSYGAAVWKMLAPSRTMRYVVGPRRQFNPPFWRRYPYGYW